ncbi:WYL domain-containing protein [Halopseudomonas pachastrellae]|nr:WYL domain-containing protein [Halopseudomonas pachastrellae]
MVRGAISYVLATIDEHEDIRQLALHRFQTVTPSAETFRPCPDFSIETYVQQGNFDYPVDSQPSNW